MPDEPNRDITPERKTMYYAGMGSTGLGMLLFCSVFVTGCMNFGNFDNFEGEAKSSMASDAVCAGHQYRFFDAFEVAGEHAAETADV